ncbi:MAG: hypothetical protein CL543_17230 [Alcanivorax sp.]|nr:hypothetical protein [Alcanivorax sp.]QJX01457.1 hypothetical protein HML84_00670 [Alcanivorax sp. IO_7]
MSRKKHPKRVLELSVRYAEQHGWRVRPTGKSAHAWGILECPNNDAGCRCGRFCRVSIWSTPANPEAHARALRRAVDGCLYRRSGADDDDV